VFNLQLIQQFQQSFSIFTFRLPRLHMTSKKLYALCNQASVISYIIQFTHNITTIFLAELLGDPLYLKFSVNWPHWSKIADFEPIFA